MATIYVALRDEGVDVWRPVEAEQVTESIYRLADALPVEGEVWEFAPGSTVRCETLELSEGPALVAVEAAWRSGCTREHWRNLA
jgi:hypothetical protein